jgi:hypothetical protein
VRDDPKRAEQIESRWTRAREAFAHV